MLTAYQKVRQDWSKYNLYNLSRLEQPETARKTFFQQKWQAKALARAYHNPYVREGTWTRMFDRRMPAVVPMDYRYLAAKDGSEMASGRGSGLEVDPEEAAAMPLGGRARPGREVRFGGKTVAKTPYMHMTFHPLERRLDTAIWRALFSSSVSQARQFVVHGWVKVNGKKMVHPGYQLNPGDMFQVDPDRVMFATGAKKLKKDLYKSFEQKQREMEQGSKGKAARGEDDGRIPTEEERKTLDTPADEEADPKKALKNLVLRATRITEGSKTSLSGKRLGELRDFTKNVRLTLTKYRPDKDGDELIMKSTIADLETALADILTKIPQDSAAASAVAEATSNTVSATDAESSGSQEDATVKKEAQVLHTVLERIRENPIDVSKPYATPWAPRDWMSAFAFIPRYLEVNQRICSAVYLRHPVARPGLAELPTPFHGETMGLAFNWYLRRR